LLINSLTYRRLTHPTQEFYRGLDNDHFSLPLGILIGKTLLFSQGDKMSNFEELKAALKDKWLDYYQINQAWIKVFTTATNSWINTPDGGKRPSSHLILGVATALETQLFMWMSPFCVLSNDSNKLVDALGLNFDPEIELEKREGERAKIQEAEAIPLLPETNPHTEYLNQFRN
ncbi:MAG: DUF5331 domain-containing protein, partial [Microcystis panniformis]